MGVLSRAMRCRTVEFPPMRRPTRPFPLPTPAPRHRIGQHVGQLGWCQPNVQRNEDRANCGGGERVSRKAGWLGPR